RTKMSAIEVKIEKKELVIRLPISPRPSKSGKTMIVASTNGNIPTVCEYDGAPIVVGVNAYTRKV
ncbi:MAG: hypothetical protein PHT84_03915, partial [Candidatus Pacebacteria bacterium]|nr:hypothetical protein [Candidatus Paceibacterota bacterium]